MRRRAGAILPAAFPSMLRFIPAVILAAWLVQPGLASIQPGAGATRTPGDPLVSTPQPDLEATDTALARREAPFWRDSDLASARLKREAGPAESSRAQGESRGNVPPADPVEVLPAPEAPPLDGLEALICAYPWPCAEALAVARCESGIDAAGRLNGTAAVGGSSYGLFQINAVHAYRWPDFWDEWMDPTKNAEWAFQLWSEQGWNPWTCRP